MNDMPYSSVLLHALCSTHKHEPPGPGCPRPEWHANAPEGFAYHWIQVPLFGDRLHVLACKLCGGLIIDIAQHGIYHGEKNE